VGIEIGIIILGIGIFYPHPKILTPDARELDPESKVQKVE
jgi:hypothetical protein